MHTKLFETRSESLRASHEILIQPKHPVDKMWANGIYQPCDIYNMGFLKQCGGGLFCAEPSDPKTEPPDPSSAVIQRGAESVEQRAELNYRNRELLSRGQA